MEAINLSKLQALKADPKAIQQVNFNENLEINATIILSMEEVKNFFGGFSQEPVSCFNITSIYNNSV